LTVEELAVQQIFRSLVKLAFTFRYANTAVTEDEGKVR